MSSDATIRFAMLPGALNHKALAAVLSRCRDRVLRGVGEDAASTNGIGPDVAHYRLFKEVLGDPEMAQGPPTRVYTLRWLVRSVQAFLLSGTP